MSYITLVLADRYPLFVIGLASSFGATDDFEIVASCSNGATCIEAIRNLNPEIAIVGNSLSEVASGQMLAIVEAEKLRTRFIVLTAPAEESDTAPTSTANAFAVLPRDIEPDLLVQTARKITAGHRALPQPLSDDNGEKVEKYPATLANGLAVLTDRERQIMVLVSKGLSNKEIGRQLNISDGTIKVHLHNIFQKLEVGNRTLLAAFALSNLT